MSTHTQEQEVVNNPFEESEYPEGVIVNTHTNNSKKRQGVYDYQMMLHWIPPGQTLEVPQWDRNFLVKKGKAIDKQIDEIKAQ